MKLYPNSYLSGVVGASDSEIQCRVEVLEFGSWLESRLQGQVYKAKMAYLERRGGKEGGGGGGGEGKKQDTRSGKRRQASKTPGPFSCRAQNITNHRLSSKY